MNDFKTLPKMQCFKTGGSVQPKAMCYGGKMKKGGEVDAADMAQDKKVVKKAFAMHDKQEHPGEKTDLSKLKKGGRTKKAVGTVKKFKCGGGVFGAKKTKEDIKNMDAAKTCKPKKLQTGGLLQEPGKPAMSSPMRKGGKIKKYAEGGKYNSIDDDVRARAMKFVADGAQQNTETAETPVAPVKAAKPMRRVKAAAAKLPMPDYSNEDLDRMDAEIAEKTRRSKRTPRQMLEEESEYTIKPDLQVKGERLMKTMGMKDGGSLKEVDSEENPGLAKLPTNVRNKMGYLRKGGKAKKMNTGGTCS
jgi:hypothetical protein